MYPALLLGYKRTLSVIDNATLLGGNVFADLVLDCLALPLIDDLALGLGPGGALLLRHGGALLLVPVTKIIFDEIQIILVYGANNDGRII